MPFTYAVLVRLITNNVRDMGLFSMRLVPPEQRLNGGIEVSFGMVGAALNSGQCQCGDYEDAENNCRCGPSADSLDAACNELQSLP
jgi:hypothetical protein